MPRQNLIEDIVLSQGGVVSAQVIEVVDGLPGSHALVVQLEIDAATVAHPGPVVRAALESVWRARGGSIRSGRLRVWTMRDDGLRVDLSPKALIVAAGFRGAHAAGDDVILLQEWLSAEFGTV